VAVSALAFCAACATPETTGIGELGQGAAGQRPDGAGGADAASSGGASGSGGAGTGGTGGGTATGGTGGGAATGGADATTSCASPLVDCGDGACVDTSTSPLHCGACNSECEAPPNATAVCSGSCSHECKSGFAALDGKCAAFGGAFATNNPAKCSITSCYTPNPYTSDCSCPTGFTEFTFDALDMRACPSGNPPYGWQRIHLCYANGAGADFGGSYLEGTGGGCVAGNPLNAGACSCPADTQAISALFDGSCWLNSKVSFCWSASAPLSSFGGAYLVSDDTSYGVGGCVSGNPAAASKCECPSGTSALLFGTVYGPSDTGCSNSGASVAHIGLCVAP